MLATWAWWYERRTRWLRVWRPPSVEAEREQASARAADVYSYRPAPQQSATQQSRRPADDGRARRRWLGGSLAGLACGLALFLLFTGRYAGSGPAIASGERWVNAEAPSAVVGLPLTRSPRRLLLSNPGGRGSVDVRLIDGSGAAPVPQQRFDLGGSATDMIGKQIDLEGIAPGEYRLELGLADGQGDLVRYVALYGGGAAALVDALLASLAAGATLACAVILALELVVHGSRVSRE